MTTVMFSQGKIKGTVLDSELNGGLPGVNVVVKGSSTGASTDIDGKFILNTTATSGQVVISYIGYKTQTVSFTVKSGETVDLGTIKLTSDANQLDEVVVRTNVIDIAKDRKTPVAVSTIKAMEIQQKLGNQEFPEILKVHHQFMLLKQEVVLEIQELLFVVSLKRILLLWLMVFQ